MDEQFITTQGSDDPAGDCRRRGLVMAATTQVTKDKQGRYRVRSQSSDNVYTIDLDNDPTCTCPDFILTSRPCKHIFRVLLFVQWEQPQEQPQEQHRPSEGKDPPVRTKKKTYPQNWQAYDSAQTHELEHFDHLLWELCRLLIQPQYQFARPPLPIADVVYAVATKAQRGMSRRRSMTDVRRAQENGFVDHVPADSSVSRYLSKPELKWLIIQSALPLASLEQDFAIDSSGIASTTYDRWYDHKWGRVVRKAQWVKMHLLCGVRTKIVIAADVSEAEANDSPVLATARKRHPGYLRHKRAVGGQGVPLEGRTSSSRRASTSTSTSHSRPTPRGKTPSGGAAMPGNGPTTISPTGARSSSSTTTSGAYPSRL